MAKRLVDVVVAGLLLVLLSPILLATAVLIRIKLGSPVLFKQVRPGKSGAHFTLIKFRTMSDARDDEGVLLPDEERMTRFGTWLRRSSLDELPELWNVLRGDMSLVGPRPLLVTYLDRYTAEQSRRHEVRPGITGWAQVNGRNNAPWATRLAMDVWYVDNRSGLLDLRIVLMTMSAVLLARNTTEDGHVTASEFLGEGGAVRQVDGKPE